MNPDPRRVRSTQKMTVGALQVIAEAGLVVPKDISFLAFDDCEWLRAMRPFLSTVSQPADDFADQAWSMLMARLNNDCSTTFRKEVHCTLIVRESTAQYHALPGGRLPKQVGPSLQAAREQGHLR
jgi:DNA-binding LacI/PurR family transcriptional regulator